MQPLSSSTIVNLRATATRILLWMLAAAATAVMCACQANAFGDPYDDDPHPADTARTVQVVFTLRLDDASTINASEARRAPAPAEGTTWGDEYNSELGTNIENYIDVSRLHVIFYNSDNSFLAEVRNLRLTKNAADPVNVYHVLGNMIVSATGDLTSPLNPFKGKVAVYANVDDPAADAGWTWRSSMTDVARHAVYAYTKPLLSAANGEGTETLQSIPMWGVRDFTDAATPVVLAGGRYNDLGEINVLRAMAKVTVELSENMKDEGYTFSGIMLQNYNGQGYIMPPADNIGSITDTRQLSFSGSFNSLSSLVTIDGTSTVGRSIDFLGPVGGDRQQSLTLYIPEYRNVVDDGVITVTPPATISIALDKDTPQGDDSREGIIEFLNYENGFPTGDHYNIVRNHHYKFTVYNQHLQVRLEVEPWTVVTHKVIDIE